MPLLQNGEWVAQGGHDGGDDRLGSVRYREYTGEASYYPYGEEETPTGHEQTRRSFGDLAHRGFGDGAGLRAEPVLRRARLGDLRRRTRTAASATDEEPSDLEQICLCR